MIKKISTNTATVLISSDYQAEKRLLELINLKKESSREIFGFLQPEIVNSDISIINIEYPVTHRKTGILKSGPLLKCPPESLIPITAAGYNCASLGNNHILNFGTLGVVDCIQHCRKAGLDTIGAGATLDEARKILYKDIKGLRIAILNFAETEFNTANELHGGANPLDIISNIEDIKKAKKNADFVIIIIHGGYDFVYHPMPRYVKICRFFAEQGVTAIINHHTHFISAYEVYRGVPIFYSLGNFIHAHSGFSEGYYIGMCVKLFLNKREVKWQLIPYHFNPELICVEPLNQNQEEFFEKKLKLLNSSLVDLSTLARRWGEEVMNIEKHRYYVHLSGLPTIIFQIFRKVKMLWLLEKILLINKRRFLFIWNILNCEHHQDIINFAFEKEFGNVDSDSTR